MKKIILLIGVVMVSTTMVQAQQGQSFGGNAKVLTVEEANKLNGTSQTTINGMPYSQYKAQQDALKQQEEAKRQAVIKNQPVEKTITAADVKAAPVRVEPQPKQAPVEPKAIATTSAKADLPTGGNIGGVPASSFQNNTQPVIKTEGTSLDPKTVPQTNKSETAPAAKPTRG
jgi:hypothetical protein